MSDLFGTTLLVFPRGGSNVVSFIVDFDFAIFQSNLGRLYQTLSLEDGSLWSNYSRSSQCEQEFPSAIEKRISLFQQVLLVQATRPDRLQSAMSQFACRALGNLETITLVLVIPPAFMPTGI